MEPKPNEALYELYDIDKDPGETTNLYFQHPEIVKRLKDKISKIIIVRLKSFEVMLLHNQDCAHLHLNLHLKFCNST